MQDAHLLVYIVLRLGLAAATGVAAWITFSYVRRPVIRHRRHSRLGVAGGVLLTAAALLSVHDAVTQEEVAPLSWLWLFGFDLLVPMWALFLVRAWRERDLAELELARLASTDALTRVLNRQGFLDQSTAALARARRAGEATSTVIIDLDRFKEINDGHGHATGDVVLCQVAAALREGLRAGDLIGRIGGEEFALLLPGSDAERAVATAERLRLRVREMVAHPDGPDAAVTVSAGVAGIEGGDGATELSAALNAADTALYQAKRSGRDQVQRATANGDVDRLVTAAM